MINRPKFLVSFIFFCFFYNFAHASLIDIKVKVQDEIITNIDIENEKRYLFFLNPKLQELEKPRTNNIAKESLITEIIKEKKLKSF